MLCFTFGLGGTPPEFFVFTKSIFVWVIDLHWGLSFWCWDSQSKPGKSCRLSPFWILSAACDRIEGRWLWGQLLKSETFFVFLIFLYLIPKDGYLPLDQFPSFPFCITPNIFWRAQASSGLRFSRLNFLVFGRIKENYRRKTEYFLCWRAIQFLLVL